MSDDTIEFDTGAWMDTAEVQAFILHINTCLTCDDATQPLCADGQHLHDAAYRIVRQMQGTGDVVKAGEA